MPTFAGLPITFMGASASGGPIPPSASQVMQMQQLTLRQWMLLILVIVLIIAPSFESVRLRRRQNRYWALAERYAKLRIMSDVHVSNLDNTIRQTPSPPALEALRNAWQEKSSHYAAPASEVRHRRDLSLAFG